MTALSREEKLTNLWFFFKSPLCGSRSPLSSFKKVDLPTPFGPTMATREFKSIPKSTLINNGFWSGYAKVTLCKPSIGGWRGGGSGNENLTM